MKKSKKNNKRKSTNTKAVTQVKQAEKPQKTGKTSLFGKGYHGKRAVEAEHPRHVERKRRKWWGRLSWRDRAIFIGPAVAAILVGGLVLYVEMTADQIVLDSTAVRYYAGSQYYLEEGTVLRRTEEDTTIVKWDTGEYTLNSLPIYYENENKVLFPQNMVYVDPRMDTVKGMDYFTEVEIASNGSTYAQRDGEEVFLAGGFAYDGGDIYFFFDSVTLEYNGYRIEIPAFSYIEAVYTGNLMIYNHGAGEQYIEAPVTDVIATMSGATFEISLLGDSITNEDGSKQLLFTRPELLDGIF